MAKQATAYNNVTCISSQPGVAAPAQDLERAIRLTKDEPPFATDDLVTNAAPAAGAFDALFARITQARASMLAVQSTWDEENANYSLPPKFVYEAFWGIE